MLEMVSDEMLIEVMGGMEPPVDEDQREAYFDLAWHRLKSTRSEEWQKAAHLLAGIAPTMLVDHWRQRDQKRLVQGVP